MTTTYRVKRSTRGFYEVFVWDGERYRSRGFVRGRRDAHAEGRRLVAEMRRAS